MKKYVLMLLFFLGCFFLSLSTGVNLAKAAVSATVTTDSYNSRKITIVLDDVDAGLNRIVINEVELCEAGDVDCQEVSYGAGASAEKQFVKILYSQEYTRIAQDRTATLTYTINSLEDGTKYLYIATYADQHINTNYSYFLTHKLSTLTQRLVINPDGNGKPMHEYDGVQYTSVRKLSYDIELLENELQDTYSGLVYVCEYFEDKVSRCGEYLIGTDILDYYLASYGDGLKQINFYLMLKDKIVDLTSNNLELEFKDKATLISKNIYLDTVGPVITVEGGNWVYVEAGKTYTPKDATCEDAIFSNDDCSTTNDSNVINIRYDVEDYQLVTYEATDRIGNTSSVTVKIKVEIPEPNNNMVIYISISAAVFLITLLILGWILIKNNEKKKKMSYI